MRLRSVSKGMKSLFTWNNRSILIVMIAVFCVIGLGLATGFNFGVPGSIVNVEPQSFTILSLSQIDYISNDPVVGGQAWTMSAILNNAGMYAVAQSNPTKLTDVDYKSIYDLTLKTEVSPSSCIYPISRDAANNVFTMQYEHKKSCLIGCDFGSNAEFVTWCQAKTNDYYYTCKPNFGGLSAECYCFEKVNLATHGKLSTPTTTNQIKITASTSDGKSETATISNLGSQQGWLNGNNVWYSWVGYVSSGLNCPTLGVPDVVFHSGVWKTINPAPYQTYLNQLGSTGGFGVCIDRWLNGVTGYTPDSCQNDFNSKANSVVTTTQALQLFKLDGSSAGSVSTGNTVLDGGQVTFTANQLLSYPQMVFKIKAAWVGIVQLVGKPKIISATPVEFTTGASGYTNVQIQNIGDAAGAFNVYLTGCSGGFSATGTTQYLNLAQGVTGNVNLYLTGTCTADTLGTCTIVAEDRNNPTNKDQMTLSTKCKTICECTVSGQKACRGNAVFNCDGCRWQLYEDCGLKTCQVNNDVASCIAVGCSNDLDCDDENACTEDNCLWGGTCKNEFKSTLPGCSGTCSCTDWIKAGCSNDVRTFTRTCKTDSGIEGCDIESKTENDSTCGGGNSDYGWITWALLGIGVIAYFGNLILVRKNGKGILGF